MPSLINCGNPPTVLPMRIYYFDLKGEATVRDKIGLEFLTVRAAIEHSRDLARQLSSDPRVSEDAVLFVSVIDESGTELHQEHLHEEATDSNS
jgi:alpha-galactosidase/6-phospho-beta-glucosidase family protein